MNNIGSVSEAYKSQAAYKTSQTKNKAATTETEEKKVNTYGRTIGEPKLSEEGAKYYEKLKQKFGNMDFILVSKDQIENAKAAAASYANPHRMVVLIDEEKIEKMATDEEYRKKYEGIIADAATGMGEFKKKLEASGAKVSGFGMQIDDKGVATYFAVLEKSSVAQKERIEAHREAAKVEKKEQEKAHRKKEAEEARKEKLKADDDKETVSKPETVTISASSIDELLAKISDYSQNERMNSVQTEAEKSVGQHIDFRG